MNAVLENILTRRSVRKYQEKQITEEELQQILLAGSYAPSGKGRQSWKFTVVQSPETLKQINKVLCEAILAVPEGTELYGHISFLLGIAQKEDANLLYHAPTYVIVSNQTDNWNAMADSALALGNMMLTAHSLGIGSCWLNQLPGLTDQPAVRKLMTELDIPAAHSIFGSIALGYAKEEPAAAAPRKDVIHVIR